MRCSPASLNMLVSDSLPGRLALSGDRIPFTDPIAFFVGVVLADLASLFLWGAARAAGLAFCGDACRQPLPNPAMLATASPAECPLLKDARFGT